MHKSTLSSFVRSVVALALSFAVLAASTQPAQAYRIIFDPETGAQACLDQFGSNSSKVQACTQCVHGGKIYNDEITSGGGCNTQAELDANGEPEPDDEPEVITSIGGCSALTGTAKSHCESCFDDPDWGGSYLVGSGCQYENPPDDEEYEYTAGGVAAYNFCRQVPDGPQRQACVACVGGGDHVNPNGRIYTALGCIQTSEDGLVADLVKLLLGVGGGVALLTILAAAFTFTTSQGDTGKVKEAKELMTAAVSGLLFTIFSVIILNFLGVTILKIPGLG